jgi:iron complex transport system ATP-binding protein
MNDKGTTNIIHINNLAVGYKKRTVLDVLNIRFGLGHFISLLGPNGAGKTTLLKTLARLLPPLKGSILIDGKMLQYFRQEELARILAAVLTEPVSPGLFSVFEFVSLGRYPHTGFLGKLKKEDERAVAASISQVNAGDLMHRQISTLSDGERQKVLLARALAQDPQVILLDEPTLHLDLKHRIEVMSILQRLCREKGITVVASLHDVDIASKVSDHVVLIKDGTIIAWGAPEEVLQEESVSSLYDFKGAKFNQWLGSIELEGNGNKGTAFVVGGIGSGAVLYRLLSKYGFSISTGILHANDLDCYVAKSIGAECVTEAPMEEIDTKNLSKATGLVQGADVVIDTGFPVGRLNRGNVQLLENALHQGKRVFTLRKYEKARKLLNTDSGELFECESETNLLEKVKDYLRTNKG